MCDYSLDLVSRPVKVGDKLVTTKFEDSLTRGSPSNAYRGPSCRAPHGEASRRAGCRKSARPVSLQSKSAVAPAPTIRTSVSLAGLARRGREGSQ
jgi:hypothetical protein